MIMVTKIGLIGAVERKKSKAVERFLEGQKDSE